jgi:uncharacterized membrane protein
MKSKSIIIKSALFIFILIWCAGFSINALSPNIYSKAAAPFLKLSYSHTCHQNSERTISVSGENFLVCSRCTGIYAGALFISFILIFKRKKFFISKKIFILSFVPLALDLLLYNLSIYDYQKSIAFATGFLSGSAAIIYISSILENIFTQKKLSYVK